MDWKLLAIILPVGYFLLRVIESLVLNVAGNILTDPIRNWLANKSLSSKRKRIDQLQKEFDDVTELYQDKSKFYLRVLQNGLYLFGSAILTIVCLIIFTTEQLKQTSQSGDAMGIFWFVFFDIVFMILLVMFMISWSSMSTLIGRVVKYDSYKAQVEKQISKLSNIQSTTHKTG